MLIFKGKTPDELSAEDVIEISEINPDHLPLEVRSHVEAIVFTAKEAASLDGDAREDAVERVKRIMAMEGCHERSSGITNLPYTKCR